MRGNNAGCRVGQAFAFRRRLVLCSGRTFAVPLGAASNGARVVAIRIRIGTRKSVMALAQTREIARRLTAAVPDIDVEIVKFETTGDLDQTGKLLPHGGKGGAFVAEIRKAVISGELQAAMHSLKDMPGNE